MLSVHDILKKHGEEPFVYFLDEIMLAFGLHALKEYREDRGEDFNLDEIVAKMTVIENKRVPKKVRKAMEGFIVMLGIDDVFQEALAKTNTDIGETNRLAREDVIIPALLIELVRRIDEENLGFVPEPVIESYRKLKENIPELITQIEKRFAIEITDNSWDPLIIAGFADRIKTALISWVDSINHLIRGDKGVN